MRSGYATLHPALERVPPSSVPKQRRKKEIISKGRCRGGGDTLSDEENCEQKTGVEAKAQKFFPALRISGILRRIGAADTPAYPHGRWIAKATRQTDR